MPAHPRARAGRWCTCRTRASSTCTAPPPRSACRRRRASSTTARSTASSARTAASGPSARCVALRIAKGFLYAATGWLPALVSARARDRWLQNLRVLAWHLRGRPPARGSRRRAAEGARDEGARHGRRRLRRLAPGGRAAGARATRCACSTRSAAQVHGAERGAPGASLARGRADASATCATARRSARALDGVEVVFHQAAAVGVGQSMYEIERYVSANSARRRGAARGARRAPRRRSSGSSSPRRCRSTARAPTATPAGSARVPAAAPRRAVRGARAGSSSDEAGGALTPAPTPGDASRSQPTSVYAVTKRDHEELFLTVGAAYGIPTVALRYFNVYGPRQALSNPYTGVVAIFSARLLNGRAPLIFEDGLQSRDFVHVSDIVQANLLALEQRRRRRPRLQRRHGPRDDGPATSPRSWRASSSVPRRAGAAGPLPRRRRPPLHRRRLARSARELGYEPRRAPRGGHEGAARVAAHARRRGSRRRGDPRARRARGLAR